MTTSNIQVHLSTPKKVLGEHLDAVMWGPSLARPHPLA